MKFETIYGTWIKAEDVEDADELLDPTGYYDYVTSLAVEPLEEEELEEDFFDKSTEGDDDIIDGLLDLI